MPSISTMRPIMLAGPMLRQRRALMTASLAEALGGTGVWAASGPAIRPDKPAPRAMAMARICRMGEMSIGGPTRPVGTRAGPTMSYAVATRNVVATGVACWDGPRRARLGVRDGAWSLAVVLRLDRKQPEHGSSGLPRRDTDRHTAIVAVSINRRTRPHTSCLSVLFSWDRCCPCSGGGDLAHSPPLVSHVDRKQPEHGDRGWHGNNTDLLRVCDGGRRVRSCAGNRHFTCDEMGR